MTKFKFKAFHELENGELYQILKLRTDVFVVEQNCPYPELDNKDLEAIHVFCLENDEAIAVARLLPPGISYDEWSLGRIATHIKSRGSGLGKSLMTHLMTYMSVNHPEAAIRISAQSHLERFYNDFGFHATGKAYLEDGIPHIEMLFKPSQ